MKKIRVNFVDFWPDFQKDNNYFYHLLSQKYDVEIDEEGLNPDLLFFSVDYGKKNERERYKGQKCKKIFFTGESVSANFDNENSIDISNHQAVYSIGKCDYAFTFDFSDDPRHFRLPLWVLQIDWFNKIGYGNPEYLLPLDKIHDNEFIAHPKLAFCAFIFNNPIPERVNAFNKFSSYKEVHGYGNPFKNWFYGESKKYNILKNYKFSICFENRLYAGYYTEKLFHAKTAGTVPIYHSDENVKLDFNEKSFINYNDFDSLDELVEYVKEVDSNDDLYLKYVNEPLFKEYTIDSNFYPENVLKFFDDVILK
jgi:hypothetical protein